MVQLEFVVLMELKRCVWNWVKAEHLGVEDPILEPLKMIPNLLVTFRTRTSRKRQLFRYLHISLLKTLNLTYIFMNLHRCNNNHYRNHDRQKMKAIPAPFVLRTWIGGVLLCHAATQAFVSRAPTSFWEAHMKKEHRSQGVPSADVK